MDLAGLIPITCQHSKNLLDCVLALNTNNSSNNSGMNNRIAINNITANVL